MASRVRAMTLLPGTRAQQVFSLAVLLVLVEAVVRASGIPTLSEEWAEKGHSDILKSLTANYGERIREHRASSPECSVNASYTGQCNLDCQCVDGKWKCCRLRKSVKNLSQEEKDRFNRAFITAATDERYKPAMRSVIWSHAVFACFIVSRQYYIYDTEVSYHNLLLLALENLLRLIDCRVTLPYWDPSIEHHKTFMEQLPEGFGGNGVPPDLCMQDGPYREGAFKVPKFIYKGVELPYSDCIQRSINTTRYAYPYQLFNILLTIKPSSAVLFEAGLFELFDANFHTAFTGSFSGLFPALDPLFFMIHNFVNKIIANYQMQGPSHLTGGGRWTNRQAIATFPWFESKDFVDCQNFPNDVCVRWDAALDRNEAIKMKYYAGLEVPRQDHMFVPYEVLREESIDSSEHLLLMLKWFRRKYSTFKFDEHGLSAAPGWEKHFGRYGFFNQRNATAPECKLYERIDASFVHTNSSVALAELI